MRSQIVAVTSIQDAADICLSGLISKLSKAIMINAADIDTSKPLHTYGVDSLVAVEIRNWIMKELQADVSVFELLANSPITRLAEILATKSVFLPGGLRDEVERI